MGGPQRTTGGGRHGCPWAAGSARAPKQATPHHRHTTTQPLTFFWFSASCWAVDKTVARGSMETAGPPRFPLPVGFSAGSLAALPRPVPVSPPMAVPAELNAIRKLAENQDCANCGVHSAFGHSNVVVKFRSFVCSDCKSAHQAYSHRVKVRVCVGCRLACGGPVGACQAAAGCDSRASLSLTAVRVHEQLDQGRDRGAEAGERR